MKPNRNIRRDAAFSLVEMLIVIAVIGVVTAIAVPTIGRINDAAKEARDMRNAQNLASVCANAQASGLNFVGDDVPATVTAIVTGGLVDDLGSLDGTFFGVPSMSAADQAASASYLEIRSGILVYRSP
ncbi:MAG: type II secretion system protein [Verrucomicrobiales bacterium]|nr:type II secretion system protein [Verrucomicrobiales bacterium]